MSESGIPATWLFVGFTGQLMFSGRFVAQWIYSERRRESSVPVLFWWLSLAGGGLLLSYAILRHDPVIILGQAAGLAVYFRNLVLIRRTRLAAQGSESSSCPPGAK
jgi:lipid-A-disaccharide synthase-like uncharacterized protein